MRCCTRKHGHAAAAPVHNTNQHQSMLLLLLSTMTHKLTVNFAAGLSLSQTRFSGCQLRPA
jgi:hypothetical protein